jgi:hypothetical protein
MKKEKQSTLDIVTTHSKKSCDGACKCTQVTVQPIEKLNIKYDTRNVQILSIDGALVDISEGGEAQILFYSAPLLKEPNVSLVQCPVEVRLKKSVLLPFVQDLLDQTTSFLKEESTKMGEDVPKKRPPEVMFR